MTAGALCPGCGSRDLEPIWNDPRGRVGSCVCRRCGLGTLCPRPDPARAAADYAAFAHAQPDDYLLAGDSAYARFAEARAALAAAVLPPGARVVEVGCGYGHFLRAAAGRGLRASGVDPSAVQVAFARDRLGVAGARQGGWEDLAPPRDRADLIASFHVLEHVADPAGMLLACRDLLGDGGLLLLDLPDALALPHHAIEHLYVVSGQHLNTFTPAVLAALLARCGFRPLYLAHDPLPGSDGTLSNLRVIARRSGRPPLRAAPGAPEAAVAEAAAALRAYHGGLEALRARLQARVGAWAASGRAIAIYGAGMHTAGLLDLVDFPAASLRALIDDDPAKHGTAVRGVPVQPAAALSHLGVDLVLVSTLAAAPAILSRLAPLRSRGIEVATPYDPPFPAPTRRVYRDTTRVFHANAA